MGIISGYELHQKVWKTTTWLNYQGHTLQMCSSVGRSSIGRNNDFLASIYILDPGLQDFRQPDHLLFPY